MSRFHSHITSASKVISSYSTGKPFAVHLKSFFAADKKFGSKDRRIISSLCYYYFRTGKAIKEKTVEEKILAGLFLCESKNNELLKFFRPHLDEKITGTIPEKISLINIHTEDIFPFADELSKDITRDLFIHSFLTQPQVYLRIRPGRKTQVTEKLNNASIVFEFVADDCLQVAPNAGVDKVLQINKDVVVQDYNSQKVLDFLENEKEPSFSKQRKTVWDCCAASGGKSILLHDKLKGDIQLTVSDIRDNILQNLRKRFQQAGINLNRSFVSDLSITSGLQATEKFSIIICDAPCTGSGTWSRNPEQLFSFDKKMISEYVELQQKIVSHTIPHLNQQGLYFYITCSVFKKENEDMVNFIKENLSAVQAGSHLQLMKMEYLKGYTSAADTMFVAVFKLS